MSRATLETCRIALRKRQEILDNVIRISTNNGRVSTELRSRLDETESAIAEVEKALSDQVVVLVEQVKESAAKANQAADAVCTEAVNLSKP